MAIRNFVFEDYFYIEVTSVSSKYFRLCIFKNINIYSQKEENVHMCVYHACIFESVFICLKNKKGDIHRYYTD